mgnify:CR=1 FL=1
MTATAAVKGAAPVPKKKRRAKANVAAYLVIIGIFIVGAICGGLIAGTAAKTTATNTAAAEPALSSEPYGTRDGKTLTEEGVLILQSSNFTPLECGLSPELQEYTYYLCEAYYLDFDFVMGLMYTESSFRADIISGTNDYGLMQINACNHATLSDKLGITDFTDPYQNIRAGVYILRGLFEKYDDAAKVCMAYNMGEYGASVLWDKGIYNTTYSNKVLAKANEYAAMRADYDAEAAEITDGR